MAEWNPENAHEKNTIDQLINDALNNDVVNFDNFFGQGWTDRARKAADRYEGVNYTLKSFVVPAGGFNSYSVSVQESLLQ